MSDPVFLQGNAALDGAARGGWMLGHFIEGGPRHSTDIEIKWGVHSAGEQRTSSHTSDPRIMTLAILIKGKCKSNMNGKEVIWENEGDYLLYSHNLPHTFEAIEDSVTVTIRWPSIATNT